MKVYETYNVVIQCIDFDASSPNPHTHTCMHTHPLNMIMFWIHLLQTNNERVVKKVYKECKSLTDNHNHKNWVWEIKSTLAECGLNQSWWHQSSCDGLLYGEAKHLLPAVSSTWRGRIGNPTLQVKQS